MSEKILAQKKMPYCAGCAHSVATRQMGGALTKLGLDPLDVVVVSDIGCCGLIDGLLSCHTVHGLHGRAVALAMGIRFGMGVRGKVIAIQGDGGATIGLQHLLEAARRNVDMTVVVQNNMVYGMTGGQFSGLSPRDFKTRKGQEDVQPYDICELSAIAGASFVARAFVDGKNADLWTEAFDTRGFSLIEIVGNCQVYGLKKIKELEAVANIRRSHTARRDRYTAFNLGCPSRCSKTLTSFHRGSLRHSRNPLVSSSLVRPARAYSPPANCSQRLA